tara:strand:- start:105 stop:938 length:834 start_codon:yes stop_codon:yes gene_type:complete
MNKENKKLGMGLSALLSNSVSKNDGISKVNISQIIPNKSQPRKDFKKEEIEELASSIKAQGLLQPIILRQISENSYEIIAGERRWRASQLAGLHEIDCVVKDMDESQVFEAALIENIQREDLNIIEEALAYKKLINIKKITNDKLASILSKSSSHISNTIRLLDLEDDIQKMVIDGKLSMGHARTLIGVPDAIDKANEIINKKLSVREAEKITSKYKKQKNIKKQKDPNITDLEKELSDKIGLKTSIQFNESGSSGSLTLYYSNLNQLDEIMKRLKK